MLRQILTRTFKPSLNLIPRYLSDTFRQDEERLRQDLSITGLHLDDLDEILSFPKLDIAEDQTSRPLTGHNLVVIQPWASYSNFGEFDTNPEIQLAECVSLGNTIENWKVVGKKIVFTHHLNRKQLVGPKAFEELKDLIFSFKGVSAVFFGVEILSGIQLANLERELKLPVYDRFTMVLNIFRQHARTKEAKIQIALAELPYIRSHLREIHDSCEYSSTSESLKLLVGGVGEKFYHQRFNMLKKREQKLRQALEEIRKRHVLTKQHRKKSALPIVSVIGYTNSGKTSLIKYLTEDKDLRPKDQLFATLDVSAHHGRLPSNKDVLYLDTVGFLSRIPLLLVEAFSATLKDVQQSDLILHILDVSHPDHKLQYATVIKALEALKVSSRLLETKLIIGNKVDLLSEEHAKNSLPTCDISVSVTNSIKMNELVTLVDQQLISNLRYDTLTLRVENGGPKYSWLRKNATILECRVDESDGNYLICEVSMSPAASGRWFKTYGSEGVLSEQSSKGLTHTA